MKERIKYYTFEKISSKMSSEFGSIKKGNEDEYSLYLFPIESNLLKIGRTHKTKNGRRMIDAIHICLFIIDGYVNQKEYDITEYVTDENKDYLYGLQMSFDPFVNQKIKQVLGKQYDFNLEADRKAYFTLPVMCLIRIEKSIELWTKEYGLNGYIQFLEDNIGSLVAHNDQMDVIVGVKGNTPFETIKKRLFPKRI